jgi:hypothetical protein
MEGCKGWDTMHGLIPGIPLLSGVAVENLAELLRDMLALDGCRGCEAIPGHISSTPLNPDSLLEVAFEALLLSESMLPETCR